MRYAFKGWIFYQGFNRRFQNGFTGDLGMFISFRFRGDRPGEDHAHHYSLAEHLRPGMSQSFAGFSA